MKSLSLYKSECQIGVLRRNLYWNACKDCKFTHEDSSTIKVHKVNFNPRFGLEWYKWNRYNCWIELKELELTKKIN